MPSWNTLADQNKKWQTNVFINVKTSKDGEKKKKLWGRLTVGVEVRSEHNVPRDNSCQTNTCNAWHGLAEKNRKRNKQTTLLSIRPTVCLSSWNLELLFSLSSSVESAAEFGSVVRESFFQTLGWPLPFHPFKNLCVHRHHLQWNGHPNYLLQNATKMGYGGALYLFIYLICRSCIFIYLFII